MASIILTPPQAKATAKRCITPQMDDDVRVDIGGLTVYLTREEAIVLAADMLDAAGSARSAVAA